MVIPLDDPNCTPKQVLYISRNHMFQPQHTVSILYPYYVILNLIKSPFLASRVLPFRIHRPRGAASQLLLLLDARPGGRF